MNSFKRILLVEDDPNDIELTLNAFLDSNLANEVVVVQDGVEALDYIYRRNNYASRPEGNPLVILLDLKLPKLDGIEVVKRLKSDKQFCLIPICILTSSREDRDMEECYKLGVNAYVVKPVRFVEFISVVKKIGVFWALINEPPPGSIKKKNTF